MSFQEFTKSRFYNRKSINLHKLGFDFTKSNKLEYIKIQSIFRFQFN